MPSITQAIILAAGKGKRLEPLTNTTPKAMVTIGTKPLLHILVDRLKEVGITDITIVVHYLQEKIIDYFGDGSSFGVSIRYAKQKEMQGTANALIAAEKYIKTSQFLCIACDSLFEKDLLPRILNHKGKGVITCRRVEDPSRYGILEIVGKKVIKIIEKPQTPSSSLANLSVYLFPKEIFQTCHLVQPSLRGEYEVTDAIQMLIEQGFVFEYEESEKSRDTDCRRFRSFSCMGVRE